MTGNYDFVVAEIGSRDDLGPAKQVEAAGVIILLHRHQPGAELCFCVAGFDDDERELWDVPEAREFINGVFKLVAGMVPLEDLKLSTHSHAIIGMCAGVLRSAGQDEEGNLIIVPKAMSS